MLAASRKRCNAAVTGRSRGSARLGAAPQPGFARCHVTCGRGADQPCCGRSLHREREATNETNGHQPVAARAHGGHGRHRRGRSRGRLVVGRCSRGSAADRTRRADALPLQARRIRGHDHLRRRGSGRGTAPDLRRERVRRRGTGAGRAEFPAARQDGDRVRAGGRQHGQGAGPVRYRQRRRRAGPMRAGSRACWPPPGSSRSRSTSWCSAISTPITSAA